MAIDTKNKTLHQSDSLHLPSESLQSKYRSQGRIRAFVRALRPNQWSKSLIVFAAPLFAFEINANVLAHSLLAFFLFCSAASGFYLVNDVIDADSDRKHPVKCHRPIAAGLVSVRSALILSFLLLVNALAISWMHSPSLGGIVLGYMLLQLAYNWQLKHRVLLDVVAISAGFILRALAGASATGITLSPWFLLCTAMLSLFLAIEKRKAELRLSFTKGRRSSRKVLNRYSLPLLNRMEGVATNGTILTYALWSSGPAVNGASTHWMMLTLPFVVFGIFRYQLLSDPEEIERQRERVDMGGKTERPEEILLRDKPILLTVALWAILVALILFIENGT